MPLYFFHRRDTNDVLLDPEGVQMAPGEVPSKALWQARDCMAGDVKSGRLDLRYHIDVHDEGGQEVHSIAFADAVDILVGG